MDNINFHVTASPYLKDKRVSTKSLMIDVCIALIPDIIASIVFYGIRALVLIFLAVSSSVLFEYLFQSVSKSKVTISDFSAVVTGILVGLNIPASAPYWLPIFGSLVAIVLVKQLFGGLGQNFMNPAMIARTLMFISWTAIMSPRIKPEFLNLFNGVTSQIDFVSVATPLSSSSFSLLDMFIGNIPGMIGEVSKLALLIGGLYLIIKKVIDWRVPLFMIATVFILFFIKTGVIYSINSGNQNALMQIMSGGLFLGAFFMATDYVTCPKHKLGRIIMGVGCGLIVYVIRVYGNYPEGVSFAVLFMNVCTPLINKYTLPKSFGEA